MKVPARKPLTTPGVTFVQQCSGHSEGIYCLAWSRDGLRLASSSYDGTVRIWDPESGNEQAQLEVGSPTLSLSWSPNGRRVVTGDYDKRVMIWDVASGRCQLILRAQDSVIYGVDWSPDGRKIASGAHNGTVYFWDAQNGEVLEAVKMGGQIHRVAWSPDSKMLGVVSWSPEKVFLWDMEAGKDLPLNQESGYELDLSWSPGGSFLASASRFGIDLWRMPTMLRVSFRVRLEDADNHAISFGPSERFLSTLSLRHGMRVWTIPDLVCIAEFQRLGPHTSCLAFDSSATRMAITDSKTGRLIELWTFDYDKLKNVADEGRGCLKAELKDRTNLGAVEATEVQVQSVSGAESKTFDVFLCYNAADRSQVRTIAERLKSKRVQPWFDEWELRPGLPWQPAVEAAIQHIGAAAVFVGTAGIGPWQYQEVRALLDEFARRGCAVIPVLLQNAPVKPGLPPFLSQMTWVDFRRSEPDPLVRLVWGITGRQ